MTIIRSEPEELLFDARTRTALHIVMGGTQSALNPVAHLACPTLLTVAVEERRHRQPLM